MMISSRSLRIHFRLLTLFVLSAMLMSAGRASGARTTPQIVARIDETALVPLRGNTHPLANAQNDRGAVNGNLPMRRMLLVMKRSAAQDKALAAAIEDMHRPGSNSFHHWLTPEQIGVRYGTASEDIAKVTGWLGSHGFTVTSVSRANSVIEFSGSAQAVSAAFHTEIHSYAWQGGTYTANASDPKIPAALAPVVGGFASLNNFPRTAMHTAEKRVRYDRQAKTWTVVGDAAGKKGDGIRPEFTTPQAGTTGNAYAVTPFDFATIYNVKPLWSAGIDGTGEQIAIVGESDINASDVDQFRSSFGLPEKKLNIIHNGPAPGKQSDEGEAAIDVEWSGAVAKNATIDFVVSATTSTTAGIDLSALYIIDNQVAPVMSESYGYCERGLGVGGNLFLYQLWQQAAAQGITAVVSAGDSGSAECDGGDPYSIAQYGIGVSGYASTPYTVAIGGTDFEVSTTDPDKYWSKSNDPKTHESALSYIPEIPWNNSCASPEVFSVYGNKHGDFTPLEFCNDQNTESGFLMHVGGGGGASSCVAYNSTYDPTSTSLDPSACAAGYPKPDWQTGVSGIPNDNVRDIPDVSLFASYETFNSFYLFCDSDNSKLPSASCDFNNPVDVEYLAAGGTSFGAPAFAGIMALVDQKTNSAQGVANYVLYSLAGQQYGSASAPNSSQTAACNATSGPGAGNSCTFYDIAEGNNAMPCGNGTPNCVTDNPNDFYGILTGNSSSSGYDLATGLGSVNAENLANNWAAITAGATKTTLAATPAASTYGQPVTLSGTVTPVSGSATPAGTIVIQGMQQDMASFSFSGGSYSQAVSALLPGTYGITASYLGDGVLGHSVSAPVALTVSKAQTTGTLTYSAADVRSGVPLPTSGNKIPYGELVVATFTVQGNANAAGAAAPTGNVLFSLGAGGTATEPLVGNTAVYSTVAGHISNYSITATYKGDSNYSASPAITTPYSEVSGVTSLEAHSTASMVAPGSPVTLVANIASHSYAAPPTGSVDFYLNGTKVGTGGVIPGADSVTSAGTGSATLVVPASQLTVGNNAVTATYSGDGNFSGSSSSPSSFVYLSTNEMSAVTLISSATAATNTTAVTLSSAVTVNGAPATLGSVLFLDNGKLLSQVPVVGQSPAAGAIAGSAKLVVRLPAGVHNIFALYSGVGNAIHPGPSQVVTVTVTGSPLSSTQIGAVSDVGTPANYDVTATVVSGAATAPTGTVTLQEPSLGASLRSVALDPTQAVSGLAPEVEIPQSGAASAIVTADFNQDGIPDFAVSNSNSPQQLTVYLGKGDGSFQAGVSSVVSADPNLYHALGIAAGDFNADGIPDLAFGFNAGGTIAILLGNGDGTFRNGQSLSVPPPNGGSTTIENIVVGDFNNDGVLDLAFANDGTSAIEVFFGVGDGTFSNAPAIIADPTGMANRIAVGDVNNDGNLDIVAFQSYNNTFAVILGKGDGTFQSEVTYPTGTDAAQGALGDLNHDGYLDIVVPNKDDQTVSVYLNNHDGTFAPAVTYLAAYVFNPPVYHYPEPIDVTIADLNNDGNLDVIVADNNTSQISVLYGRGDGTIEAPTPYFASTGAGPSQVVVADLNSDGTPDILVNETGASSVGVLLGGYVETTTFLNVPLEGATTESETLTATYSGDGANAASTSPALTLMGSGAQLATKLDWSPSATTSVYGMAIPAGVLDATVEHNIPGSIAYTAQLAGGASAAISAGGSLPAAGAYTATATFTPTDTSDYAPSSATIALTVQKANVTDTLTSSVQQAGQGASVTLTDAVASKTSGTPTGLVTFFAGSSAIGSAPLNAAGVASITVDSLPAGSLSITASYLGDGNFNTDTSAATQITIGTPSISFTVAQSGLTLSAGASGTVSLTAASQLGFTGNVVFACGSLPPGVTCSFAPASGSVGAAALQSALTVATTAPSSSATTAAKNAKLLLVGGGVVSLASVAFLWLPGRRKRITWLALALVACSTVLYTGCGGSSHTASGPATTTVALTSSSIKSANGASLTLDAAITGTNASSSTGTVTFYDGTTQIGQATATSGKAQITLTNLSVGAHSLTAVYAGDTLNDGASSPAIEQVITGQTTFAVTATSGSITQSATVSLTLQ